jgi:hypothetical protein
MAYSQVTYTGNGVTKQFAVPFPYILKAHVTASVAGVLTSFTWVNTQVIEFSAAPANGAAILISRESSRAVRLVDYADGQTLTEGDLDQDSLQAFYLAQEAFDNLGSAPTGGDMRRSNNLSDVLNAASARANLGVLATSGGTLTGAILNYTSSPSAPSELVPKSYVDAAIASINLSGGGVTTFNGRNGGVTLLSADVTGALAFTPVNKAGDTLTGPLFLAANPTDPAHAANKAYVDAMAVTGGVNLAADYAWTGTHTWTGNLRYDKNYKVLTNIRTDNGALSPLTGEHNSFAGFVTRTAGSAADSIVPFVAHGVSDGTHSGNVWGIATEAYNAATKNGGYGTQLFGGEFSILNLCKTSTAPRHAGLLVVFKNRMDVQDTPVNGVPSAGQAYNKNTCAVYIDTGAGRVGSSSNPYTGNASIECGWNKGIYFSPHSLDTAAGVKAVAIDLTALDAGAPEGNRFRNRVESGLALPDQMAITLATNKQSCRLSYDQSGMFNVAYYTSNRFGVGMHSGGEGIIWCWNGQDGSFGDWWIDISGSQDAIMRVASGSRTQAPSNGSTIANWLNIRVDGIRYALPLYL